MADVPPDPRGVPAVVRALDEQYIAYDLLPLDTPDEWGDLASFHTCVEYDGELHWPSASAFG
jgi:hypothetical protein